MDGDLKVSIVMQSYLGEYNNGRKDSEYKFKRAVNSFLNQWYDNQELIIVSDGCIKTWEIYKNEYSHISNIKFVYLDKKKNIKMYDKTIDGKTTYRGYPRNFGITAADGDIIAYLDADDMLYYNFTSTLVNLYKNNPNYDWFLNTTWIGMVQDTWFNTDVSHAVEIDDLPGKWMSIYIPEGQEMYSTMMVSHKNNLDVKWMDTYDIGEDGVFVENLIKKYPNYGKHCDPIYVYCHHYLGWYDV